MPQIRLHDVAFYSCVALIVGIALASFSINIWIVITAYAVAILSNLYFKGDWRRYSAGLVVLFGFFYYNFYIVLVDQRIPFDRKVAFQGIVISDPQYGAKAQEFDIDLQEPWSGSVHIYADNYPEYHYGDLLELSASKTGAISKSPTGKTISGFPKIKIIGENNGSPFKAALFKIKDSLVDNLQKVLSPEKSALASGVLLGARAEFSDEFKDAMKKSGTTHIVALSGYNISIIGVVLSSLLSYFFRRSVSFYISVFAIIAFVLMTGAEPSAVRAAFMGVIALVAEKSSRVYSFRNAITISASIMLLLNPRLLVFDVGFELSFLALLGIVYIEPLIKKLFKLNRRDEWSSGWRKNMLQTLSAQIAVAPVALYVFGYLSPFALFANLLILEFIPLTMLLALIVAVSGSVSYGLSLAIGWILSSLLGYEIFIINFFSFNWL